MNIWDKIKKSLIENFPDQIITDDDTSISYTDLIVSINNLSENISRGNYVVLCHTKINFVISILSCMKSNVSCLPMSSTKSSIKACPNLIEALKINGIITDYGGQLHTIHFCLVESDQPIKEPSIVLLSETSQYILLSYKRLSEKIDENNCFIGLSNKDSILIYKPLYHFHVFTKELLPAILSGLKILFTPTLLSSRNIVSFLQKTPVSTLFGTSSLLTHLSDSFQSKDVFLPRKFILHNDSNPIVNIKSLQNIATVINVYHTFSMENSISYITCLPPSLFENYYPSVGYSSKYIKLLIVNEYNRLLMPGNVGKIMVCNSKKYDISSNMNTKPFLWQQTGLYGYLDPSCLLYIMR